MKYREHRACDWLNAKNVEVYGLEERLLLAKALIYVKKSSKCSWFVCPHCNNMKQLRSYKHQVFTINLNKVGLSPYDDKRYISEDGVTTLAHGHYSINTFK